MRRRTLLAVCATSLAGLAGCQSIVNGSDEQQSPGDTVTPTPTTDGDETGTPTRTETETPPDVSVEYEVRAGDVPDALQSLEVDLRVVFVGERDEMTACLRETYTGPYKPTITPIPTPTSGACHRSQESTFDLAEFKDGLSLGPVTAPGSHAAGHALVVTDVTATTENGETAAVKGTGGHRANVVEGRPESPYHVELDAEAAPEGASYDYELVSTVIEPAN